MIEAVVLARRSQKEWDELISLYSKELGKVELTVRGTKKIVSKNSPFLEPFSCVDIAVVPGKDRQYITTTQSVEYFSRIRKNLDKSRQAAFVVAWLEGVVKPMEKNEEIYDTLMSWLHFINDIPETKNVLVDAFILKMIALLGFEPSLHECAVCGRMLGEEKMFFSFSSGGIICHKDKLEHREDVSVPIFLPTLLALRYLLSRSWREIVAFTSAELSKEIHKVVYPYIVYALEKECVDWDKKPSVF